MISLVSILIASFLAPEVSAVIGGDLNCTSYNGTAVNPRLNCATITLSQCNSVAWRTIIAQDCPSSCGFCLSGGCVDAVTNCGTDLSICQNIGMQDFVNQYCQKTCGRCASSTTSSSSVTVTSGTCTSYIADTTTQCAAWATNGFCTNTFYTLAQRRARCATTCRIC
ncbi:Protein CBG10422 [Caenorhabditis briggsae]|uniref:Protein CBG10422 n=1 Tax=Caenorhabditis briggsae TaxID=6238 RepID=A8XB63_CAEBR|nr:Protein CBG10422 [Caenorhabditis briggsae]CAP29843.2 Protein CBG10422 [Caenorhabditis briggsae]